MATERKPFSVKIPCDLPDSMYKDTYVMRKTRITIREYETISRLSRESARARMRLAELEVSLDEFEGSAETREKLVAEAEKLPEVIEKTTTALRTAYSKVIVEWNFTDDYGDPLPDPYLNADALSDEILSMDEYRWITEIVQDGLEELRIRAGKTLEGKNLQGS